MEGAARIVSTLYSYVRVGLYVIVRIDYAMPGNEIEAATVKHGCSLIIIRFARFRMRLYSYSELLAIAGIVASRIVIVSI